MQEWAHGTVDANLRHRTLKVNLFKSLYTSFVLYKISSISVFSVKEMNLIHGHDIINVFRLGIKILSVFYLFVYEQEQFRYIYLF